MRNTVWKVSKYGVFSGPYFPEFEFNTERYFIRSERKQAEHLLELHELNSVSYYFIADNLKNYNEWQEITTDK